MNCPTRAFGVLLNIQPALLALLAACGWLACGGEVIPKGGAGPSSVPNGPGPTLMPNPTQGSVPDDGSLPKPLADGLCIAPSQEMESGFLSPTFHMQCAGCHGTFGEGKEEYPALPGKATSLGAFSTAIRGGAYTSDTVVMPAFHSSRYADDVMKADFEKLSQVPVTQRAAQATQRLSAPFSFVATADSDDVFQRGLKSWRTTGAKGACASCHGPMGVDLARIKFTDADILRRCFGQKLKAEECLAIVDMIHTVRARFAMKHFCPKTEGFLQPGHQVLAGHTPEERDLALVQEFERVGLPLFTKDVSSRSDYAATVKRFQALRPTSIRVGFRMNSWTEDRFFGDAHLSSREWIPDYPSEPTAGQKAEWYALHDAYIANPSADNLWRIHEQVGMTRPAPAYTGPDLSDMAEEMKKTTLPKAEFLKQKIAQHAPLAPYEEGFLTLNFTNWSRNKYRAVLVGQHMMIDNVIALPKPPSYRSKAELANKYGGMDYGSSGIWNVGDNIISGCLNGCWNPEYFLADMSPAVAATTRFGLNDGSVYADLSKTASSWPFMATLLDYGEQQLRVTNEYYFGNFGSENHIGHKMYLHQLWARAVVGLGDLFLVDMEIPQRKSDRDYRSTFNAFDHPEVWLKGQVWGNMGGAMGGNVQTDAYAKRFAHNMLRISLWAAEDMCSGQSARVTNKECPIGDGEHAGRALHACEAVKANQDGFDYSQVADACQVVIRCASACNPKR
jgi:cytochrome c553